MAAPKRTVTTAAAKVAEKEKWPFGRKNYILLGVALAVIIIGFVALSQGSITLAPLLLVIGYLVLVPWALLAKDKGKTNGTAGQEPVK